MKGRRERRKRSEGGKEGRPTKNRISLPILIFRVRTDEGAKVVLLDFVLVPVSIALAFLFNAEEELGVERKD